MKIVNVWIVHDIDNHSVWMGTFDSWSTAEIFASKFDLKDARLSLIECPVLTVDDL